MKYLIDTDWVINHLRGVERTTKKLEELAPPQLLFVGALDQVAFFLDGLLRFLIF